MPAPRAGSSAVRKPSPAFAPVTTATGRSSAAGPLHRQRMFIDCAMIARKAGGGRAASRRRPDIRASLPRLRRLGGRELDDHRLRSGRRASMVSAATSNRTSSPPRPGSSPGAIWYSRYSFGSFTTYCAMKYAATMLPSVSPSDRGADAVEELPPGVERVLQGVAHAILHRGVARGGRRCCRRRRCARRRPSRGCRRTRPPRGRARSAPAAAAPSVERAGNLSSAARLIAAAASMNERCLVDSSNQSISARVAGSGRPSVMSVRARPIASP